MLTFSKNLHYFNNFLISFCNGTKSNQTTEFSGYKPELLVIFIILDK